MASLPRQSDADALRAVLRFYAAPVNHHGVGISAVYNDRGRRAREALGGECRPCFGFGTVIAGSEGRERRCESCKGKGYRDAEAERHA